ncbi:mechanosensitive ion channel domain-containing protein [Okeania sp.]|uniref:mechanosensitive ion channel family protein n=1 Tax=Okeania sp. TaxID=3100323 RepID=UPI002B4B10F1|nr:mechanosensitive ion channel domain-containing protein [Okeania sp.]MEB3341418.1 mechanosensitive ion channel domain-containing protein [Okeania sp.]
MLQGIVVFAIILLSQYAVIGNNTSDTPLAPPITTSPYNTLREFIVNMNKAYVLLKEAEKQTKQESGFRNSPEVRKKGYDADLAFNRALQTLNLEKVAPIDRKDVGIESALLLKEVLDRVGLPPVSQIPNEQTVAAKSITRWNVPKSKITIELVKEGYNEGEFLFSTDTVERLKTFYQEIKNLPYNQSNIWKTSPNFYSFYISTPGSLLPPKWSNWLPKWTTILVYGQTLWQWFSLVTITLLLIAKILAMRLFVKRYYTAIDRKQKAWLGLLLPLLALGMIIFWQFLVNELLNITGKILENLLIIATILEALVLGWLVFMVFNGIGSYVIANTSHVEEKSLQAIIARHGFDLLGILAALIVFYYGSAEIGIAVGPILASLGVGGIAIGLGVRPYIENMVGGLTLFINRSVQIGDFCELGGVTGTIEDIGLQGTLIRREDRTLITVPNTVVSTSQIVNHSRRDKYVFKHTVVLNYEIAHNSLPEIMENLRSMFTKHPKLNEEKVSLTNLNNETIELELFAYVLTIDSLEYLNIEQELLLNIKDTLELMGVYAKPA